MTTKKSPRACQQRQTHRIPRWVRHTYHLFSANCQGTKINRTNSFPRYKLSTKEGGVAVQKGMYISKSTTWRRDP